MYCRNCGSPIPNGGHFCPKCGARSSDSEAEISVEAPKNPEAKPRKKRKAARTLCLIFLIPLILILLGGIGLTAYSVLTQPDPRDLVITSEASGHDMLLWADRTDLILTEQEETTHTVHLTVHNPVGDSVDIREEDGTVILTLTAENLDEEGNWSADVDFTLTEPKIIRLAAKSGKTESLPLLLYAAPEITSKMVEECSQVGVDLSEYLRAEGYEPADYNQKALDLAADWLIEDDRIAEIMRMDTTVYYLTTQNVVGGCTLPPAKNSYGAEEFSDTGTPLRCFETWKGGGDLNDPYIYSENTITNNHFRILRPIYSTGQDCKKTGHFEKEAEKLAEAMGGEASVDVYDDLDALNQFYRGALTDAGVVVLNTHGGHNDFTDSNGQSQTLWTFILYEPSSASGALFELLTENELKRTGLNDNYQMFYGDLSSFRHDNLENIRLLMEGGRIHGTSNYLMSLCQNQTFDNTFLYFGVCYSACDSRLGTFFISHGASSYAGYQGSISVAVEKDTYTYWIGQLSDPVKGEQRLQTIGESRTGWYGIINNVQRAVAEGIYRILNWAEDQYCYAYTERENFTFYGYGALEGTVKVEDDAESPNGTTVRLYRYLNRDFEEIGDVTVKDDGHFSFEDLPWGVYVAAAEKEGYEPAAGWLIFQSKAHDGGEILLEAGGFPVSLLWHYSDQTINRANGEVLTRLHGLFPEISYRGDKEVQKKMEDRLREDALAAMESYLKDDTWSNPNTSVSYPGAGPNEYEMSVAAGADPRMDDHIICIAFCDMTYASGAAHPYHRYYHYNFDPDTGDLLTLADILEDDDAYEKLGELIAGGQATANFVNYTREDISSHIRDYWNSDTAESNRICWYFNQNGLCLTYSPGQIASYSAGVISWDVPYFLLEGIVKATYLTVSPRSQEGGELQAHVDQSSDLSNAHDIILYDGPGDGSYHLVFTATEPVYDVCIYDISGDYAVGYGYADSPMVTLNTLSPSSAIMITCGESSPEAPNIMAVWNDGGKETHEAYYSIGADGVVTVIPGIDR